MSYTMDDINRVQMDLKKQISKAECSNALKNHFYESIDIVQLLIKDRPTVFSNKTHFYIHSEYDPELVEALKACKYFTGCASQYLKKSNKWKLKKNEHTEEYLKSIAPEFDLLFYNTNNNDS